MTASKLKRLHTESIVASKVTVFERLSTEALIRSLSPGSSQPLIVKADGTVMEGNHRILVLESRGVDVDSLPREDFVTSTGEE